MPRLSILIPFLGHRDSLENTLASVLQNRPAGSEIIVALGCDYDDPYQIDEEVRFTRIAGRRGLIDLVNDGFRECLAPIVHLLACGVTVSEGWTDAAVAHFRDRRVASVAPLIVDADAPDRVVAAGLEYLPGGAWRRRGQAGGVEAVHRLPGASIGAPLAAGFYRRSVADNVRGLFDRTLGSNTADVDLALRLLQAGHSTVFEPNSLVLQPASTLASEKGFSHARQAERIYWRHAAAHGSLRSAAAHGPVVAGEFFRSLPRPSAFTQLAGRLLACCEWGYRRRQQLLLKLPAPVAAAPESGSYRMDRPHVDSETRQGETAPAGRGRSAPSFSDRRS